MMEQCEHGNEFKDGMTCDQCVDDDLDSKTSELISSRLKIEAVKERIAEEISFSEQKSHTDHEGQSFWLGRATGLRVALIELNNDGVNNENQEDRVTASKGLHCGL